MTNINRLPIDLIRRPNESTAEFLGRVLDALELKNMAGAARAFHYDDYFCPPTIDDGRGLNIDRLIRDLKYNQTNVSLRKVQDIDFVIDAAKDGVFYGTKEESDKWAASEEGRKTLHEVYEWMGE